MKTAIKTLILVVALMVVTAIPAWAGQGVGSSPYTADLLVSGLNTGTLNPGQEYWYAYSRLDLGDPNYDSIILSLNFEAEGRAIASRVNFQVFGFSQVETWLQDSSGPVDSLGLGTPASTDFNTDTSERLWAGPVAPAEVYYVRVFNISPSPVQYRLTALGQKDSGFESVTATPATGQPEVIPAAISRSSEPGTAAEFIAPASTNSTVSALPVLPDEALAVSTNWLLAAQAINGLPPHEAAAWLMSAASLGWLPSGNASPAMMPINPEGDLVTVVSGDDSGNGESDVIPGTPPDPTQGYSIYPNQPVELIQGPNIGRLSPMSEHWYAFTAGKVDEELFEDLSLTIFFTPGEPNIANLVTFQMFTADQYHIWERGTPKAMEHFGVGSWVSRDGAYETGERLWHGTVVDGDKYFIKLTNNSDEWIDYHLLIGDIINIEMGPKTQSARGEVVDIIPGKDIGTPLTISAGHTRRQLEAGEDIWYSFESRLNDPDKVEFHSYEIQLEHTPGAGHIANHVNVEIYPYQEQQIWQRGDTDDIIPLGAGMNLRYNKTTDTNTWVWDGHLVSNTTYFIRIRNDSTQDINFDVLIKRKN